MISPLSFLTTTPTPQHRILSKIAPSVFTLYQLGFGGLHNAVLGAGGVLESVLLAGILQISHSFPHYYFVVFSFAPMSHLVPIIPQTPHRDSEQLPIEAHAPFFNLPHDVNEVPRWLLEER